VVNRKLAEHYWPGQDPIGKRIHLGLPDTPVPWMTVVGEIGDIKETSADAATKNQFYVLSSQVKASAGKFADPNEIDGEFGAIVLRSQLPPEQMIQTLRRVVRSIDPQLPLTSVHSMDEIVQEGQASQRFNTVLVSSFAVAALLLALLGAYSVIAFSASLRTHEMAIRLALGGQRSTVAKLVLATSARMALLGCGLGFVASLFATRLLRSMLYEVNALDLAVIVASTISILVLVLAVSTIPARRAASVDPMQSLRAE
jgi:ABC-type antimicrobial peptide transport system permease subunit